MLVFAGCYAKSQKGYFEENLDLIQFAAIFNLFETKKMRMEYLSTEEKLQPLSREVTVTLSLCIPHQ